MLASIKKAFEDAMEEGIAGLRTLPELEALINAKEEEVAQETCKYNGNENLAKAETAIAGRQVDEARKHIQDARTAFTKAGEVCMTFGLNGIHFLF